MRTPLIVTREAITVGLLDETTALIGSLGDPDALWKQQRLRFLGVYRSLG